MPDAPYLLAAVVTSAAVAWGLRALPFAVLDRLRASPTVTYLAAAMPAGIMITLAAYCLRDVPHQRPDRLIVTLLAVGITVGLHLWRRSALLSILVGTATYVTLVSTLLAN
ncbi:branched-chain amino acid ABC transporter [Micromonospora sp. ALFpr18c]|uniref:branched-chain amino acid transporter permease n=1 Tax=unclassified Micromonospora TaxID=2617518 RepID=UPI00124AFC5E|nr:MULTISPECIES: AzlD domain-containing protein [unclassified Micromonospora]KAB1940289.1 branched-chain amino acid ABC transporter [Micromonospora sp. ALFpr18c]MDG4757197.1 AzlD domain-containing protein [Micromonospora sp. WMMD710]